MLTIIVADTKSYRAERIAALMKQYASSEAIVLDDTVMTVSELEQYLYPSLFTVTTPTVHARFILDNKEKEMTALLVKKLLASPTIFILEELSLSKPFITSLKKQGVEVHEPSSAKATGGKIKNNLFGVTSLVTITSKKDRWLAYQKAIAEYPIEAILGMLYWKVRDLVLKEKNTDGIYHTLYTALLAAHAAAWQDGTPLELAIEKTLLVY
jgi:hypothetical protein